MTIDQVTMLCKAYGGEEKPKEGFTNFSDGFAAMKSAFGGGV